MAAKCIGVGGDVNVETTRGDIEVRGGSGFVSLKSVQGEVTLEKAKGRIEVRAVNEGIRLADISGDLSAESTNGSIILDRIDSGNVDLYTVNGNISYDGPIKEKGLYRLTTHNGLIAVAVLALSLAIGAMVPWPSALGQARSPADKAPAGNFPDPVLWFKLDEASGTLYLPVASDHKNQNAKLMPFIEKRVKVTGTMIEKGGVKGFVIKTVESAAN